MTADRPDPIAASKTITAVVAYLSLLDSEWDLMTEGARRDAVRLALEAARRARA
jgi:hypothetical protein